MLASPFEVFSVYCSIKAHYATDTYNHFQYRNTSASSANFQQRNDKKYFQVFANRYDISQAERFFAVNFAYDSAFWIGKAIEEEDAKLRYNQNIKIMEGFQYFFEKDLQQLEAKYGFKQSLTKVEDIPEIFFATIKGTISFETFSVLLNVLKLDIKWGTLDGFFCESVINRGKKFFPFLSVDPKNVISFLKEEPWGKNNAKNF